MADLVDGNPACSRALELDDLTNPSHSMILLHKKYRVLYIKKPLGLLCRSEASGLNTLLSQYSYYLALFFIHVALIKQISSQCKINSSGYHEKESLKVKASALSRDFEIL